MENIEKMKIAKKLAKEIYGKYISDLLAERYAKGLILVPDGCTIELEEVEDGENGIEWTIEVIRNKLNELKMEV